MSYWQLYYHLVWGTKERQPIITPELEPIIYYYLKEKATELGARIFAINGVEDHVHLAVAIPPKIAVSKFIGQIKATSSAQLNKKTTNGKLFYWQNDFGVFSFSKNQLHHIVDYIDKQKEHHSSAQSIIPALERVMSK